MKFEVMDPSGHSVLDFEKNKDGLLRAEEKFRELTGQGFRAAVPTGDGEHTLIKSFDEKNEEVLFIPRLVGG